MQNGFASSQGRFAALFHIRAMQRGTIAQSFCSLGRLRLEVSVGCLVVRTVRGERHEAAGVYFIVVIKQSESIEYIDLYRFLWRNDSLSVTCRNKRWLSPPASAWHRRTTNEYVRGRLSRSIMLTPSSRPKSFFCRMKKLRHPKIPLLRGCLTGLYQREPPRHRKTD